MSLASLTQLKARLGITDTNDNTLLTAILAGVSAQIERYADRSFEQQDVDAEYIDVPRGDIETLALKIFPVVSITAVTEALYKDHASADELTEDEDFFCDYARGLLHRAGTTWLAGRMTVLVEYEGGYVTPDTQAGVGWTLGTGEIVMPADLVEAAIQQASFVYQRRHSLGLTSESVSGGSISAYATDELLPAVKQTADRYRRLLGI